MTAFRLSFFMIFAKLSSAVLSSVGDVIDGDDDGGEEPVVEVVAYGQDEGVAERHSAGDVADFFAVQRDLIVKCENIAGDFHCAKAGLDEISVAKRENLTANRDEFFLIGGEHEGFAAEQTEDLVTDDVEFLVVKRGDEFFMRAGKEFTFDFEYVVPIDVGDGGSSA